MQARYYDPVIGRFLSNDPVGYASGGVDYFNRYAYTANNPVNLIDPDGRQLEDPTRTLPEVIVKEVRRRARNIVFNFVEDLLPRVGQSAREAVQEEVVDRACNAPSVGGAVGVDAFAGLGTTVQGGLSFDPATGQVSAFGVTGVGVGGSLTGSGVPAALPFVAGVVNAPSGISGDVAVGVSGAAGGRGAGVSRSVAGSSQGDTSATVFKATPGVSANATLNAQVSLPVTPKLFDLGCN